MDKTNCTGDDRSKSLEENSIMSRKLFLPILLSLSALLGACAAPAAAPTATVAPTPVPPTATTAPTVEPTAAPTVEPTPEPIALTDSLGREVKLAATAQRIVSLAPSNTEILFALGAGNRLVGRDDFSDYPAEALKVPSIGSLYPNVNPEVIVALKPDLVLAAGITNPDDVKALADLGLTVYATHNAASLDDVYHDILAVGQLVGRSAEAETLVADMKARVAAVTAKTATLTDKPKVFYELDATDPSKPYTSGAGTFIDQLLTLAGGDNIGRVGQGQYFQISLEELIAQDPAIVILGSFTYGGQTPAMVKARVGWDKIAAVKNNAVYTFDDNLVSRPGPRVVEGLETLAKLIHPELFK
jgi:cobalamin transport system substrate-binding protein